MSYDFSELEQRLKEIKNWLSEEFSHVSTGRANPALVDSIKIEAYGSVQPLKNLASIGTEDARTLRIAPWDKSQIKDMEKVLNDSGLPFTISADSEGLRATIPQLTEEKKEEVIKFLKKKLEEARISVRQARQDVEKDIDNKEKESEITEDDKYKFKKDMQDKIDDINNKLEELFEKKEAEVREV